MLASAGIYTTRPLAYMNRDSIDLAEGLAMRAEAEKLVEAIRQSLALLRRHL